MKWFLLLVVIGLSVFDYNQQRSLDAAKVELEKARVQISDLEKQIPKLKQQNPFLLRPPANANNSPGPQGPWKGGGTALDLQPEIGDGGHGRGRK